MSKKSKKSKKNKAKKMRYEFENKRKKGKGKVSKKLGGKTIKATLGDKQYKKLDRKLEALSDIPELREPRKICNHQGKKNIAFVSLRDYEGENFVVKNLDSMADVFGEENIGVCKKCRIAVPEFDCIKPEDIDRAHMVLVGAIEHIVTRTDDRKEVELLHKSLKGIEEDLRIVRRKFNKIYEKGVYSGGKIDRDTIKRGPHGGVLKTTVRQTETQVTAETSHGVREDVIFTQE